MHEQHGRGLGNFPQEWGIAPVIHREQMIAGSFQPGEILLDPPPIGRAQIIKRRSGHSQLRPFCTISRQRSGGRTKMFQQPRRARRTNAWRPQQRE